MTLIKVTLKCPNCEEINKYEVNESGVTSVRCPDVSCGNVFTHSQEQTGDVYTIVARLYDAESNFRYEFEQGRAGGPEDANMCHDAADRIKALEHFLKYISEKEGNPTGCGLFAGDLQNEIKEFLNKEAGL